MQAQHPRYPHAQTAPTPFVPAAPGTRLRNAQTYVLAAILAVCTGIAGLTAWQVAAPKAEIVGGAADLLAGAPAVSLGYVYRAADGAEISGSLAVTADGHATGTVADGGAAGLAAFAATPDGLAVYGDADWWLRRAPDRVTGVQDRWVQPDGGEVFPFDVTTALNPLALADLVREVAAGAEVVGEDEIVDGIPVATMVSGDWTLRLARETPARIVSLAGPIGDDGLEPSLDGGGSGIVPVGYVGNARRFAEGGGGTLLLEAPAATAPPAAAATSTDSSAALAGDGATPPGMAASPDAPPGTAPPAVGEVPPVPQPMFTTKINASPCSSKVCSWSVSASNVGNAPGSGYLITGAAPVMAPTQLPIAMLAPGATTDFPFSAGNPAPPGGSITVNFTAMVFCKELYGPDPKPYEKLVKRGVDPAKTNVGKFDKAYQRAGIDAMNKMLDEGASPEQTLEAMESAEEHRMLPEVKALAENPRFKGLGDIAKSLASAKTAADIAKAVDTIDVITELLTQSPDATVTLVPKTKGAGDAETLEIKSPAGTTVEILTRAPEGALPETLNKADELLKPQETEKKKVTRITVEPKRGGAGSPWQKGRPILQRLLQEANDQILGCLNGGGGGFDELIVTNDSGTHTFTWAEVCSPDHDPEKVTALKEFLAGHDTLRDELVDKGLIFVDENGQVTGVERRKDDEKCKSTYAPGPLGPAPADSMGRTLRATGSSAYLCDPLPKGQKPGADPWSWPTGKNPKVAGTGYIFQRCHLVGRQLGGSGAAENLVTCYGNPTNSPEMSGFESTVAGHVKGGEHIVYIVVPIYGGTETRTLADNTTETVTDALSGIEMLAMGDRGTFLAVTIRNVLKGS